ncbi:small ubiquitin-related modifier-like [Myzus persicae]|uniref:small ubiquitin-related modifier-like n=1 Tax=Myzus persicae TaxID=13164 RepID=UPI000B938C01|nr:small ubiquitin-related modifier-like [Myzus persicae]XP_022167342.1 small ubiquitin-related modifier-like [Myzus persicae]
MSTGKQESSKLPSAVNGSVVPSSEFIRIRVITSDSSNEVHFRLKPDVAFARMKTTYCKKLGHSNKDELRFVYDGIRIADNDTPKSLDMMDGDVVEIYQERTGGGM